VWSVRQLAGALDVWRGHDVKVSELVDGLPVTVSACVCADRIVVSGVSHQLVGYDQLTGGWGQHCGNQLLQLGDLPQAAVEAAIGSCLRLGEALRARGYLGMFGIDAIVAGGAAVQVIEINPRIQGVSSLLNRAELDRRVLPAPGTHLLAHLLGSAPAVRDAGWPRLPLSQVVLYARRRTTVAATLEPGIYGLGGAGTLRRVSAQPRVDAANADCAAVWPFVRAGMSVDPDTRLAVLQFPRRVAPVTPERRLFGWAEQWIAATKRALTAPASTVAGVG
jgi:hypothetical protein